MKSICVFSLTAIVSLNTVVPQNKIIDDQHINNIALIQSYQNNISWKKQLQQFLTELFTKDGRDPTDVEFVDDQSEKMLNRYGLFFTIFIFIFILLAINSLFFHDK